IKKENDSLHLDLERTTDILAELGRNKGATTLVGFAAETDHVAENARKKLTAKNADLIVANDVTAEGAGFDSDTNVVTLFSRDGGAPRLPKPTKKEVAPRFLAEIFPPRSPVPSSAAAQRSRA